MDLNIPTYFNQFTKNTEVGILQFWKFGEGGVAQMENYVLNVLT